MDISFHYYCIGALARCAGFKLDDALTIAYASQYVDDATENKPIGPERYEPVCSAYSHIKKLKAFTGDAQEKVLIPFHFLPSKPKNDFNNGYDYITRANSKLAQMVMKEAIAGGDDIRWPGRLCRIGVALHTYADTWSHSAFSGRTHEENNIKDIEIFENNNWTPVYILKKVFWDLNIPVALVDLLCPKVGHVEAGFYPDRGYCIWKYSDWEDEKQERYNPQDFLTAAKNIYKMLFNVEKPYSPDSVVLWSDIEKTIKEILEYDEIDIEKRCLKWKEHFSYLNDYDKKTWRKEALGDTPDWDFFDFLQFKELEVDMHPDFYNTPWVHYHEAARAQRKFVRDNIVRFAAPAGFKKDSLPADIKEDLKKALERLKQEKGKLMIMGRGFTLEEEERERALSTAINEIEETLDALKKTGKI